VCVDECTRGTGAADERAVCLADGGSAFFRKVTTYVPNYTAKLIVTVLDFFFASNAPKLAHSYKSSDFL